MHDFFSKFNGVNLKLSKTELASNREFSVVEAKMRHAAEGRFVYKNLPKGIPEFLIEKYLFYYECVVFFQPTGALEDYAILPPYRTGPLDLYWRPTLWNIIGGGQGTHQWWRDRDDSVLIFSNPDHQSPYWVLEPDLTRMARLNMIAEQNIDMQSVPYLVYTTKEQELTTRNEIKRFFDVEKFIIRDQKARTGFDDTVTPEKLDLGVEFKFADFMDAYTTLENRCYTYLGINNNPIEKRERVQTAEVEANNNQIAANLQSALDTRRKAFEEINEKFGLNIQVELRDLSQAKEISKEKEEDNGGNVPTDTNRTPAGC